MMRWHTNCRSLARARSKPLLISRYSRRDCTWEHDHELGGIGERLRPHSALRWDIALSRIGFLHAQGRAILGLV